MPGQNGPNIIQHCGIQQLLNDAEQCWMRLANNWKMLDSTHFGQEIAWVWRCLKGYLDTPSLLWTFEESADKINHCKTGLHSALTRHVQFSLRSLVNVSFFSDCFLSVLTFLPWSSHVTGYFALPLSVWRDIAEAPVTQRFRTLCLLVKHSWNTNFCTSFQWRCTCPIIGSLSKDEVDDSKNIV